MEKLPKTPWSIVESALLVRDYILFVRCFAYLIASLACLTVGQARAQVILQDDFQDGEADGWTVNPGRGSIDLTEYGGNISMRMTRDASAFRPIDISDVKRVTISADFAAQDLEGADACLLEFSEDGAAWIEIGRIEDSADDGLSLHSVSKLVELSGASSTGFLGARIKGNAGNDVCWLDNVNVFGASTVFEITPDVFEGGVAGKSPFATTAFSPPEGAKAPAKPVTGILRFSGEVADQFRLIKDEFKYAPESTSLKVLPPIEVQFVQVGDEIVPVRRGPRPGNHRDWEWIVEPGRVWEDADGATRGSFPFALQERNANCVHNGLATFRIDTDGQPQHLVYQIGSETCAYMQFDLWGAAPFEFEAGKFVQADVVAAAYTKEKAARLQVRQISRLGEQYAGKFGAAEEVRSDALTLFGYVAGDTHFVGPCPTRYGAYPFCDVLDLPSYSWSKSIVAGIGAMRLEKLYPGAMEALISDYVPECATARWEGVTFADALNMTTGVYASDVYDEDERSPTMRRFFLAETHAEKISLACGGFPKGGEPGVTFVYRTGDTYILGVAMSAFLRARSGDPSAELYNDLLVPVFEKLGVSPLLMKTRRTRDDVRQPFTGWGLTMHRNDVALLVRFLQGGGVVDGETILDEKMLAAALQRSPDDRGAPAVIDGQRYKNGFWAWNAGPALGCEGEQWIPAMSGFGGLSAALMPNGTTYYYVSDGRDFAWRRAAQASNEMDAFCETENDK